MTSPPNHKGPEPGSLEEHFEGFNAGAEWMRKRNADRITALEEALREAVERRDYFAKEILQSCIYARRDQWCASINCRCQQARRALAAEGEGK